MSKRTVLAIIAILMIGAVALRVKVQEREYRSVITARMARVAANAHQHHIAAGPRMRTTQASSMNVVVDGAKNPELIPDDRALAAILLASSYGSQNTEKAKARATAFLSHLHLSPADRTTLATLANNYRHGVEALIDEKPLPYSKAASDNYNRKQVLLQNAVATILPATQSKAVLSPSGMTSLRKSLNGMKRAMRMFKLPDMDSPVAKSRWNLFSTQTVHAQMGGLWGNSVNYLYSGDDETIRGMTSLDATSSCGCHNSQAGGVLQTSNAGIVDNIWQSGAEYVEADTVLNLQNQADFDAMAGQTVTLDANFESFCPIANQTFFTDWKEDAGTGRSIYAYYWCDHDENGQCNSYLGLRSYHRCNPTGYCDNIGAARFNPQIGFPLYALIRVLWFDMPIGGPICAGFSDALVPTDMCHSPDPNP